MFLRRLNFWYEYGPAPREWWAAGYPIQIETAKGIKTQRVDLDWIRSAECPKSTALRDPAADELVRIFLQAQTVGESPFGSAEKWPGSFYDSVKLLKEQQTRDEDAQQRAIHKA